MLLKYHPNDLWPTCDGNLYDNLWTVISEASDLIILNDKAAHGSIDGKEQLRRVIWSNSLVIAYVKLESLNRVLKNYRKVGGDKVDFPLADDVLWGFDGSNVAPPNIGSVLLLIHHDATTLFVICADGPVTEYLAQKRE